MSVPQIADFQRKMFGQGVLMIFAGLFFGLFYLMNQPRDGVRPISVRR